MSQIGEQCTAVTATRKLELDGPVYSPNRCTVFDEMFIKLYIFMEAEFSSFTGTRVLDYDATIKFQRPVGGKIPRSLYLPL